MLSLEQCMKIDPRLAPLSDEELTELRSPSEVRTETSITHAVQKSDDQGVFYELRQADGTTVRTRKYVEATGASQKANQGLAAQGEVFVSE